MSWDIFGKLLMGQTWLPWLASGEQHNFKTLWRKGILELNIKAAWDFNIPLPLRKWKCYLWRSVSQNTWPSEKGHQCVVHNFWQRLCQGTAAQTVSLNRVPQSCSGLHWPGVNLASKSSTSLSPAARMVKRYKERPELIFPSSRVLEVFSQWINVCVCGGVFMLLY